MNIWTFANAQIFDKNSRTMKINRKFCFYSVRDTENEPIAAILNLFGCIDPERTTHEQRGLNVTVRLRKTVHMMWPRLIKSDEKCNWIKADMNRHGDKWDEFFQSVSKNSEHTGETRSMIVAEISL